MKRIFLTAITTSLVSIIMDAEAQSLFNVVGNTTVKVKSSEILTIQGGLSNASGGVIDNDGTIYVSGDWSNDNPAGGLSPNSGTVELNGNITQTIGGTQPTTFNNLTCNGQGSDKKLGVNTTVGGTTGILSIGSDAFDLNGYTLTVTNPSPSAVSAGSGYMKSETLPPSYSRLTWNTGSNNGTYVIPFGSGAGGSDLLMSMGTSGASGNGSIGFATFPTTALNTPLPSGVNVQPGQQEDIADRFWIIDPQGFSVNPAFSNLTFTYNDPTDIDLTDNPGMVEADLQAVRYNANSGLWLDWGPSGTANTAGNTVTVASVNPSDFHPIWGLAEKTVSTRIGEKPNQSYGIANATSQVHTGNLHISFNTPTEGLCSITLYDVVGHQVAEKMTNASAGINQVQFPLSQLGQAMYLAVLRNEKNQVSTRKVVISR
jgi:hypothetical protein